MTLDVLKQGIILKVTVSPLIEETDIQDIAAYQFQYFFIHSDIL